jgi:metal-dependent hydrolase (beta-lactamase superfamily II)
VCFTIAVANFYAIVAKTHKIKALAEVYHTPAACKNLHIGVAMPIHCTTGLPAYGL